jgi:choline kinase
VNCGRVEWKYVGSILWLPNTQNPLDDAETMKIEDGLIKELGKKPKSYDDIQGQYIGLMKV